MWGCKKSQKRYKLSIPTCRGIESDIQNVYIHIDIDAATAAESALLFDGHRELCVNISIDIVTTNSVHRQRVNSYHNFLWKRISVRRRLLE